MMGYILLGAPGFPARAQGPSSLYRLALSVIPVVIVNKYWGSIIRGMNYLSLMNGVEVVSKPISILILVAVLVWLRLGVMGAVIAQLLGQRVSCENPLLKLA